MRTFIAVEVPENIRETVMQLQKKISDDSAKLSRVGRDNMHLTLKFLGDVDEKKTDGIKEALTQIKQKAFSLTISKIRFFPDKGEIRVVWLGFKDNRDVFELQSKVDNVLLDLDFAKDKRFHPHLTVARVKFVKDTQQFVKQLKELKVEEHEFDVSSFRLMKSTLTPNGPIYEVLAEFPLD